MAFGMAKKTVEWFNETRDDLQTRNKAHVSNVSQTY